MAPGYEADVWVGVAMRKVRGKMRTLEKKWDPGFYRSGSQHCYELENEIDMLIEDNNNILSESGLAVGADWRTTDCFLRYQPYHLE